MSLSRILGAFALTLSLAAHPAAAMNITNGVDYQTLSSVQPTDSPGKVEVTEFFAYTCPHCYDFEPTLNAWIKTQPKNVVVKRVPVAFSSSWEPMARAYFALRDIGALDRLHEDVFKAIHQENQNLMVPDTFFDWGAKHGLDRERLKAIYNSFSVNAELTRAKAMTRSYQITGVPTLAINGKYLTSASMTGSFAKSLQVASELIRMESTQRKH